MAFFSRVHKRGRAEARIQAYTEKRLKGHYYTRVTEKRLWRHAYRPEGRDVNKSILTGVNIGAVKGQSYRPKQILCITGFLLAFKGEVMESHSYRPIQRASESSCLQAWLVNVV
jgi:hypothetical protein